MIKKDELSEDMEKAYLKDLQDLVDKYNKQVDEMLKEKEEDLMSI